jgi:hypothetical protein
VPPKSPGVAPALALPASFAEGAEPPVERGIEDDRDTLADQPFVLIVEDDPTFAGILLEVAHEASLKGVISSAGIGHAGDGPQDAAERDHARPLASATSTASCCSTCCARSREAARSRST